jgi:amino acid adenylation domain-containing protein
LKKSGNFGQLSLFGAGHAGFQHPVSNAGEGLIHKVFEAQVRLTPNLCAVEAGEERLTYLELSEAANRVAGSLTALGVGPETLVGICIPRSIAHITGLIGILKAGGVYVPLDPALSREGMEFIINDAKIQVIVTDEDSLKQLPRTSAQVVCLDAGRWPKTPGGSATIEMPFKKPVNLATEMTPANLAYVCYTSGSTGVPKGVCIPHRGVVRLVKGTNYAQFSSQEVFLHASSNSFDASTFEIWGALLNGGRLVIFRPGVPLVSDLTRIVQSSGVTTLWLTSALFNRVMDLDASCLRGLRQLLVGGDVLSAPHVQKALDTLEGCQLINGYGPTENTTFTCCYPIRSVRGDSIPIGQPITNTYVHILGPDGQPVPSGAVGELYIGGAGLARGYLNRPELTPQKFVRDPFSDSDKARLFKSGDRVRRLADGNIEFVGRWDRQVKLRGFRVELDPLEAALRRCHGVQDTAVIVTGKAGRKRLVAYIVPKADEEFVISDFRKSLTKFGDYAVPNAFVSLAELPITKNGKTDYAALASMSSPSGLQDSDTKNNQSAVTLTQKAVRMLWSEVLGLGGGGIDDDFFEAGGDSLKMVTLFELVERRFNKSLCLSDYEKARTVRGLAELLDNRPTSNFASSPFVVALKQSREVKRAPLFLVAGAVTDRLQCYLHLVSHFPSDQAIWGLDSPETAGGKQLETVESIAAHHVRSLRSAQPRGPYYLAGFCFGGLVAFEMAQQLSADGEEVKYLGIMGYPLNHFAARKFHCNPPDLWKWTRNAACASRDLWDGPGDKVWESLNRWVARARYYIMERLNLRGPSAEGDLDYLRVLARVKEMPEELAKRVEMEHAACRDYQPRLYAGPVTLFRPRRLPIFQPYDETLDWKRIVRGRLDVCIVPGVGFHGCMVSRASAPVLASLLDHSLTLAQNAAGRERNTTAQSCRTSVSVPHQTI